MGQKIHPVGFRLGINQNHQSKWFSTTKIYPKLILEDYFLRKNLFSLFPNAGISKIYIQRNWKDHIQLTLYLFRLKIFLKKLKKTKNDLNTLQTQLEIVLKKYRKKQNTLTFSSKLMDAYSEHPKLTIQVAKILNSKTDASFIAGFLVKQLEDRSQFRIAMKETLDLVSQQAIKGIKIRVSGRLNGAEIARSEWIREGQVPLQTLQSEITYCYRIAKTVYGILGVKICILKK